MYNHQIDDLHEGYQLHPNPHIANALGTHLSKTVLGTNPAGVGHRVRVHTLEEIQDIIKTEIEPFVDGLTAVRRSNRIDLYVSSVKGKRTPFDNNNTNPRLTLVSKEMQKTLRNASSANSPKNSRSKE